MYVCRRRFPLVTEEFRAHAYAYALDVFMPYAPHQRPTESRLEAEFFWAAYTKLDDFYALAEDWLVEMETTIVDGKKRFRKRGRLGSHLQAKPISKASGNLKLL